MLDSVSRHQDVVGALPGWTGRAVDVAVSADGTTIAAVRDDGAARVWHTGAPEGAEFGMTDVVGIAVSDDGSTVAVMTAETTDFHEDVGIGALEEISLIPVSGGETRKFTLVRDDERVAEDRAQLSFRPGSRDIVLISSFPTMLFDPSRRAGARRGVPGLPDHQPSRHVVR